MAFSASLLSDILYMWHTVRSLCICRASCGYDLGYLLVKTN